MRKIDFSKMTPETYNKVLETRKTIEDIKKEVALTLLEITPLCDDEKFLKLKNDYIELQQIVENFSEELELYEL